MQAAAPARRHARLLALRAIMDGREVPVVVLRGAGAVAHYADLPAAEGAVLVVTAADAAACRRACQRWRRRRPGRSTR